MALFDAFDDKREVIEGYISKDVIPEIFPVFRVITAKSYKHEDTYYFRTREIAGILGIKQPSYLVKLCKKTLGENCIVNGDLSTVFRKDDDDERTAFISADDLLKFLTTSKTEIKDTETREKMTKALRKYTGRKENQG